jgi:pimeloyl-ACP methyl ester carboxylesterase
MTIIAFEGLASYGAGFVLHGLLEPLHKKYPGALHIKRYAWNVAQQVPSDNGDGPLIIVGHSFGGPAALNYATRCKHVDLLVTMDPRLPTMAQFKKQANVGRLVNVYRTGFMPGYAIEGAENIKLPFWSNLFSHTSVPYQPIVLETVSKFIEGKV